MDAAWPRMAVTPDALSQCIVELRKAFGDHPKQPTIIETIPKVGIRLIPPVARVAETPRPRTVTAIRLATSTAAGVIVLAVTAAIGSAALWFGERNDAWRTPLAGAQFRKVTDFVGAEEHAAISRDGRFVSFLSDRDGAWDVWIGSIKTADFRNLTNGAVPDLRNPAVRMLGFSPAGDEVLFWTKMTDAAGEIIDYGWTVPIIGGPLRQNPGLVSELDYSMDAERIVYHPSAPGDPLFVSAADDTSGGSRIYVASSGTHCHFPVWSPDGKSIYFVQGIPPDEMDVWRVPASGGEPERLTYHNSRVSFPTLLDERTLLYLATAADGSGPWLHTLDLKRLESHRLDTGSSEYSSIAASADGRRIVVTEPDSTATLWRVPLGHDIANASKATQVRIPTRRGMSPRLGPDFLVYRAPTTGADGLWALVEGEPKELWSGADGPVVAAPALAPDGGRLAFVVQRRERAELFVMKADGSDAHVLASELDVRGAPDWSPDGAWIAIAALRDGEPRLYKIPLAASGAPVPLGDEYGLDPAWSPSGEWIVYSGADVGTTFALRAVSADGTPHEIPPVFLNRGSRRLHFLGGDKYALVVLKGSLSHKEFWRIDLQSGAERRLTDLGTGPVIADFDVSADGTELVFDRVREESNIVAIDLPERK